MWAPPPSGYVDECVCQIDKSNAVRYVIQDASYDVVALVAPQTQSVASKVIGQYTWDPYGQVLTAEYSGLAATYNKLGHHGLFADRLDANYTQPTLAAGFMASTHLPARIVYQVRNRTYDPSTQRWMQRDPNATGQVVLGSLASGGQRMSGTISAVELASLCGDGMSLYGYVRNGPIARCDPAGLEATMPGQLAVMGAMGRMFGIVGGGIGAMVKQFLFAGATVGAVAPAVAPRVYATDWVAVGEQLSITLVGGANLFAEWSDPLVRRVTDPFRDFFDVVFSSGEPVRNVTPDEIAYHMSPEQRAEHGDPNKWNRVRDKRGSGKEGKQTGDVKILEIWRDEYRQFVEVHFFRGPDGYVKPGSAFVHPYSP